MRATTISELRRLAFGLLLASSTAACDGADPPEGAVGEASSPAPGASRIATTFEADRRLQWKLPRRLREISGLALDDEERLFAIADEIAEVHLLDYDEGDELKRFRVGDPVIRGDFEGIAAHEGALYTVTSNGELLRFSEGEDRTHVPYERFDTGLARECEIEGLEVAPEGDALLIACKRMFERADRGRVRIHRWRLDTAALDPTPLDLDEAELARRVGDDAFEPSGLARTAEGDGLWVVAARQRAVALLAWDGSGGLEVVEVSRFPDARRHRQAEGIAVTADGTVLVADEGGDGRGRLARYARP